MLPLRIAGDDLHPVFDGTQLCSYTHDYMAICKLRAAFGVVADEVEGRAGAASGGVHAVGAVIEKLA